MADFKYIIVGRGMMGAAAAKHLAKQTDGVAVIGPDEPENRKTHEGVFASHYDEGRITRTVDPDRDWALLANRSIARYPADRSGERHRLLHRSWLLRRRAGTKRLHRQHRERRRLARRRNEAASTTAGLKSAFPFFALPEGSEGVFQAKGAGHISPRRLVKAQSLIAEKAGATVVPRLRDGDPRRGPGCCSRDFRRTDLHGGKSAAGRGRFFHRSESRCRNLLTCRFMAAPLRCLR